MQHDFNYAILDDVEHRPWPMPDRPWIMTQTWHDVLFAHWAVDAALLSGSAPLATWALTVRSWAALVAGDVAAAIRFGEQAVGWIEGLVDVVSAAAGPVSTSAASAHPIVIH